ncbi:MAG TPA: ABC transporter ATP-binding protein [Chloroflexota bacterium]|jgi:NitT/TauT family transport system ATP-binding protein
MTYHAAPVIRFQNVYKAFGGQDHVEDTEVLREISLDILPNQFVSLIGPSGCGKTTMLRMCAGLVLPSSGAVYYQGREIVGLNRGVGFVTQDANLYPWMTMRQNIELPLELRGVARPARQAKSAQLIDMVGLNGFENHYPSQLSGGMQKRASIIRTLIYDPDVILMDEPFGPLDAQTRMALQNDLLEIWDRDKKTIVFVTHDLVEAVALSDVVVLLTRRPGVIKSVFRVDLERPRNVFEIHDQRGFSELYHEIWNHFKPEMRRVS